MKEECVYHGCIYSIEKKNPCTVGCMYNIDKVNLNNVTGLVCAKYIYIYTYITETYLHLVNKCVFVYFCELMKYDSLI